MQNGTDALSSMRNYKQPASLEFRERRKVQRSGLRFLGTIR